MIEKDDAQDVYNEDDPKVILRGKDLFEMHCNDLQSDPQKLSVFDLKKNSTLNSLKFFHLFVIIFLWTLCMTFLKGWLSMS